MRDYHAPFKCRHFYHVYNRGNNQQNIFLEEKNYTFFLKRWDEYLGKYLDVWAYCLMPNHFHFIVRVKDEDRLAKFRKPGKSYNELISNQFRKLFIAYTKSFNKVYERTGSLFQKPFKRVKIDSEQYLQHLIHYIHHNPIHHHFVDDYTDWKYSSYSSILSKRPTKLRRKEILKLFRDKQSFTTYHEEMKDYNKIDHLIME